MTIWQFMWMQVKAGLLWATIPVTFCALAALVYWIWFTSKENPDG